MVIFLNPSKRFFTKNRTRFKYSPESHREGIATYFREYLERFYERLDYEKNPKPDGGKYNLYK